MRLFCENIHYRYPTAETHLFQGLTAQIEGPGFHALFGPSGVGKTSFARIITGEIPDCEGAIHRTGITRMAYTYNLERLPNWSTIARHLDDMIPTERLAEKAALIETFGLEPCMDQRFSQLSLGQKNRVNLLRYLLQGFDMLVLDESLANVDELTRERIILRIKALFPGTLFFYISHNVIEVSKFCNTILVFRSVPKSPPVIMKTGLNLQEGEPLNQARLQAALLEIMHAA